MTSPLTSRQLEPSKLATLIASLLVSLAVVGTVGAVGLAKTSHGIGVI